MTLREIDALVAERVMGWTPRGEDHLWTAPDGLKYIKQPYYSTDVADSKQVREKLAERFYSWDFDFSKEPGFPKYEFSVMSDDYNDAGDGLSFTGKAETEELAVALCALKTAGVDVEVTQ